MLFRQPELGQFTKLLEMSSINYLSGKETDPANLLSVNLHFASKKVGREKKAQNKHILELKTSRLDLFRT